MASYSALQRARRQSRASPVLAAIYDQIFADAMSLPLVQAAADGRPPAGAISGTLVEHLGREAFTSVQARQHAGLCIAARLEGLGWIVDGTRARLRGDPLFQTASLFKRAPAPLSSSTHAFLERFVSCLDETEAGLLADLLEARRKRGEQALQSTPNSGAGRREYAKASRHQHED